MTSRRLLLSFLLFLSFYAGADNWVHHLPFGGVDGIAETSRRVYYTSLGALYAYDKRHSETMFFLPGDYLNDVAVTGIYAPVRSDVVAVTYASGNIDIIGDDGTLLNLPDIKISRLAPRDIHDVAFSPDRSEMCVATGFGAVLFNLDRGEVSHYLRTSSPLRAVSFIGSEPAILIQGVWMMQHPGSPFGESGSWQPVPADLTPRSDESITIPLSTLPSSIHATCISATSGLAQAWIGTPDGLYCYDLSSPQPRLKLGPVRPGEMSVADVNMLRLAPSGNLYIGTRGNSNVHINRSTGNLARLCRLTPGGTFTDLTPRALTSLSGKLPDTSGHLFDLTFIREDPDDPSLHYAGSLFEGFYTLDHNEEVCHFYLDNTRFLDNWGVRVMDLAFDPRGGMWAYSEAPTGAPMIHFLPPAARQAIPDVTAADWIPVDFTSGIISGRDCTAICSFTGRYLYSMGSADIYIYDTASTLSLADDTGFWARSFITPDGASVPVTRVCSIMEDPADGSLWIGTDIGVLVASRPCEITDGAITVSRPVVCRDDGTPLADYLLATERIYGISSDPLGNKWIATASSGAWLVSPDGTHILQHFTPATSPLPVSEIRAVACRHDGTVFFGTSYGLFEYQSDYRPGADSFSSISIYPNPVRPDYLGDVIIDGLPDGALIKIVDASGALVTRLRSEGSRLRWNPRNNSLAAGVYHIIGSSPSHAGRPLGKLTIIR